MTALPYQPVPTIAQRKALHADHAKRYARQCRDNQDEAIADMHAARLRYELARMEQAERAVAASGVACCADDAADEMEITLPVVLGWCAMGIGAMGLWAAVGYATWWLVGLFMGVK